MKLKNYFKDLLQQKPLTKRIKIDTGFACNAKCFFCYYKKNLKDKFFDINKIYFQLVKAKQWNFKKIDFSGGESSYHPEFQNMLKKAQKYNFYITTLSNGIKFSDFNFTKESKNNGLNEILFSVHGLEKEHNISTGGDNFKLIMKAIENALKLNIRVRINTTIHSKNLSTIIDFYKFMRSNFNYDTHNFIFINNFVQNSISLDYLKYKEKIKDTIIFLNNINPDIKLRYIPFCFIDKSLHNKNFNLLQHYFDQDDWFPGIYYYDDYQLIDKKFFKIESYIKFITKTRKKLFYKDKNCEFCSFNVFCDGYKKS
jgi:MoaA/NifB/PqqE/SkfB family radical SAM enzyme